MYVLAFWSAKDVPQVHWRRLQVMLKKKQASKPRKQGLYRCCAADQSTDGQYQLTGGKDQSTGGSDQSTDSPQEHCAGTVHKDQSTDVPVSRLMVYLRVWQSTDMPVSRLVLSRNIYQSTGGLDLSTDRLGRVLEQVSQAGLNF